MMKYQTIIDNHYFDIMVGFVHTHTLFNVRKSLGGHVKNCNSSVAEVSQILFGV